MYKHMYIYIYIYVYIHIDYCSAINALLESNLSANHFDSILVIAPFFPIAGDIHKNLYLYIYIFVLI
jgi:hypothetical protein